MKSSEKKVSPANKERTETDAERKHQELVSSVHAQWDELLAEMIAERRADHIDDHATDEEIACAILEKLVGLGVVRKNAKGEYILPRLTRP
jgi:uncharacterized protein YdbL (DUF1318 family)